MRMKRKKLIGRCKRKDREGKKGGERKWKDQNREKGQKKDIEEKSPSELERIKMSDDNNQAPSEPESARKLFLGGLDYATTEDGLRGHFDKYGKLVDVVVMRFPDTKRSRGFGLVFD